MALEPHEGLKVIVSRPLLLDFEVQRVECQ